jgi:CheY-like chemotaxis protein
MSIKILLVEDNEMNRDMLTRRLTRKGFAIISAGDGQTAINLARSEKPDLILMDMSLPVIDGWEASVEIKSDAATRSIPIIALTAHAMMGDRERALESGCDEYETKPIDLDRLIEKIGKLSKKD